MRAQRGAALIDVVFTAGLVAVLSGITVPILQATREHAAARAGARFLASRLQQARLDAIRHNAAVAVRFMPGNLDAFGVYLDGDGDGVAELDITAGVDPPLSPPMRLSQYARGLALGVIQNVPEPDTGLLVPAGSDPLRIGRTTIVSFSPLGSATSGTLYFSTANGSQFAIRIFGATGRMRLLEFDTPAGQWREQ